MTPKKTLFLLDAYALIYRAHFAFTKSPRINSKGINTSVPFGFTNTLMEVLQKQNPSHIAVVFDTAAPTFRDEIYDAYKATRQETPEDVRYGIPKVKEIVRGFNIPVIEMDGYEADDIIGTLAKKAVKEGFMVYMMTPDKDFGQIVEEHVLLYKPAYMGNAVDVMGVKEVCEKWDIEHVDQVRDILGLQGDSSDNIPGIPGVGPKTAAALIRKYGSIEEVIAHSGELKGRQKELVETYGEQALVSKKLATIIQDVPIAFDEETLRYTKPNEEVLRPIFQELEFRTFINRLFGDSAPAPVRRDTQLSMFDAGSVAGERKVAMTVAAVKVSGKPADINAVADELKKQKEFAIVINRNEDQLINRMAFSYGATSHCVTIAETNSLEAFRSVFEDEKISKTGHDLKAILLALKEQDITMRGALFDTMIAHYLVEPEAPHDLDVLFNQYLDDGIPENISPESRMGEQAIRIMKLKPALEKELAGRGHKKLMEEIEMPLVSVLASMEFEGVRVDTEFLEKLSGELRKESARIQGEIYELAGEEFNINSPKQLGEILFVKMKLDEKAKKTKTGQFATGEGVMQKLAAEHPIAGKILDYREYDKLRSTYVEALPRMVSPRDGRIHTDYRQAIAATGRLSSNNPNLQNIPIRTEKGRQIRKAFVPRNDDYLFMSADYSQIELRIAASFAKDQVMIEAFRNKRDIHTTTAARVFKVALEEVTPDMRRKAKEVNFGILYGSTVFGLSQNLNIPRAEAAEIIRAYFEEFPAIKQYMDNAIATAREEEYVVTLMGRRRYLRDINSRNMTTRGFAERNAINAPIQGSAADIIKIAMVNIHRWMEKEKLRSRMILQVHDELVFDVHKEEVDVVRENVTELMKNAVSLEVPMEVEVGVGKNWLEAH